MKCKAQRTATFITLLMKKKTIGSQGYILSEQLRYDASCSAFWSVLSIAPIHRLDERNKIASLLMLSMLLVLWICIIQYCIHNHKAYHHYWIHNHKKHYTTNIPVIFCDRNTRFITTLQVFYLHSYLTALVIANISRMIMLWLLSLLCVEYFRAYKPFLGVVYFWAYKPLLCIVYFWAYKSLLGAVYFWAYKPLLCVV